MKTALIVVAALVVIGGAGFVIMNNKKDSDQNDTTNQPSSQQESSNGSLGQPDNDQQSSGSVDPNNYASAANVGETVDATGQKEVTVSIDDDIFETTYLKIKKGTKVTWVNNGQIQHDVTSNSSSPKGGLASDLLSNGDTYEFTFEEAGVYEYFCTPHPTQMRGVITVVE